MVQRVADLITGAVGDDAHALEVAFDLADAPGGVETSAVDRAVSKFPQLGGLVRTVPIPGMAGLGPKRIGGTITTLPFEELVAVLSALPRSLPFYSASVMFTHPSLGAPSVAQPPTAVGLGLGVFLTDSWWVNGRLRSYTAGYRCETPSSGKTLRSRRSSPPWGGRRRPTSCRSSRVRHHRLAGP